MLNAAKGQMPEKAPVEIKEMFKVYFMENYQSKHFLKVKTMYSDFIDEYNIEENYLRSLLQTGAQIIYSLRVAGKIEKYNNRVWLVL